MRRGIFGVTVAALALVGGRAAGQAPPPPAAKPAVAAPADASKQPPVLVTTSLNKTAVWVGDPIVWTVEITCAPNVDVIADDLAADKLQLTGLEVAGSENERIANEDGTTLHRIRYRLRTFDIGQPALRTAPLAVRYYVRQPGQRAEDVTPAGEIQVPGAVLAWRSTIPENLQSVDLRAERRAEPVPQVLRVARPVGIGLVLVSIAPVALWGLSRAQAARGPRVKRRSPRASRNEARATLEALRNADTATETDRREAYGRLNTALRRHVGVVAGMPALALTPEEVVKRLQVGGSKLQPEGVGEVLTECDRARFGPPEIVPPSDQFQEAVTATERLL
jgi:hypothetical protein